MQKLLVITIIIILSYQGWIKYSAAAQKSLPLYEDPYIVVYGRNTCGFTQQTIKDLTLAGIPFEYQNIDEKPVADLLHSRMRSSGINTRRYNLPVVDVSNEISIRPKSEVVIKGYKESII